MCCLKSVVVSRHLAWFDGFECAGAVFVCGKASKSIECRIERFLLRIVRMAVLSVCIGLPDFDHCIVERRTIAIKHAAGDADALAFCCRCYQGSHRPVFSAAKMKKGSDGLRRCCCIKLQRASPPVP